MPVSVACTVAQMLIVNSSGLTQRSGALTSFFRALPDLNPFSASEAAFGLVIRDRPIYATEVKISTSNSKKMVVSNSVSTLLKAITM